VSKKQFIILLVITNVISVGLVLLFLSLRRPQKETSTVHPTADKKPIDVPEVTEEPKQTAKNKIDSILTQYDVIKSGRYRESMKAYRQAIRQEPTYTADSTTSAYYYAVEGSYEKAIETCEKEIQESSQWPTHFYTLAWIYAKIGRYEEAIVVSKEAIKLHPRYSNIWHVLGWIYAKQGQNDKAMDACNRALEIDPHSAQSHYGLGRIYLVLDNPEKAVESFKQAVQLQSDFAEANLFLGLTYAELGNHKEAIDSYSQALLLDKYYPEPYFLRGVSYDEIGQCKKAIESFKEAITWYAEKQSKTRINSIGIKPDMANIYHIIGVCHLKIDQYFEASLAFQNAIDIDGSYAGAHYGLALAHVLLDDKDAAIREYEVVKALKGEEAAKPLLDIIQKDTNLKQ